MLQLGSTGAPVPMTPEPLYGVATAPWNHAVPAPSDPAVAGTGCAVWEPIQSIVFQVACLLFFLGYLAPSTGSAAMFVMHAFLSLGFITLSLWGLLYACAVDIFVWNLVFCILNICHAGYLGYQVRPIRFTREERDLYNTVFKPFQVPRIIYRDLCNLGKISSLKIGEHYAEEGRTPCNRLSIIIFGKVKVFSDGDFLHNIQEKQFLDSPEWDSFSQAETRENFQVTLTATTYCRYMSWQRDNLRDFLGTHPYLKQVFANLIGTDITRKLYLLTERNLNHRGSRADLRLPSVAREASPNHDLRGHLAAGGMGACGVGIPVLGTSQNQDSFLQSPNYGQQDYTKRPRVDAKDSTYDNIYPPR
ncbi:popeye domain-containing protein 3-like [Patiria miniata]|uniref:POPDC1-3 domain-containing protein n=1 Tax=Patiria miniata TaxID=46514 RepID=A0A914BTS4_PATMI|nr:popeye domain-containing protein 3-like [Patiria miniata]